MDFDLPEYILDIERQRQTMSYGRLPLEIIVSDGKISKVIGTKSKQVKFRTQPEDQKAARLYVLDIINTGSENEAITFTVVKKAGVVSQVNTFEQIETVYKR